MSHSDAHRPGVLAGARTQRVARLVGLVLAAFVLGEPRLLGLRLLAAEWRSLIANAVGGGAPFPPMSSRSRAGLR